MSRSDELVTTDQTASLLRVKMALLLSQVFDTLKRAWNHLGGAPMVPEMGALVKDIICIPTE